MIQDSKGIDGKNFESRENVPSQGAKQIDSSKMTGKSPNDNIVQSAPIDKPASCYMGGKKSFSSDGEMKTRPATEISKSEMGKSNF